MEHYLCGGSQSVVADMIGGLVRSATLLGDTENLILVIGAIDPSRQLWSVLIGTVSEPSEIGGSK